MGNSIVNAFKTCLYGRSTARVVFLGLDAVGKTSLLYRLKRNENMTGSVIPTCGFNVETVCLTERVSFTIWDVGGGCKMPPLWRHYYLGCQGIVFIVDANDPSRFIEAKKELDILLESDEIAEVPFLVLANKQDLPGAVTTSRVAVELGLDSVNSERVLLRGTSALTGDGIREALIELNALIVQ